MKKQLLLAGMFVFASVALQAAEIKSEAELGMVITSGNSETQSTNGKISASRDTEKWSQHGSLEALSSSNTDPATDKETTTAEKYAAKLQADYNVNPKDFAYASGSYDDDRFSGFEYQATVSAGYGRHLIKSEKQELTAQVGPGMRYFKLSPDPVAGHIPSDDEAIAHMAAKYQYNFSEQAAFTQEVTIDAGEDVTISESVTALRAKVNGKLAMKASVKFKNTSEVPAGTEKTDSETALTLVYSLK